MTGRSPKPASSPITGLAAAQAASPVRTVGEELGRLLDHGSEYEAVPDAHVAALADHIETAIVEGLHRWGLDPDAPVIRIPKSRLADLTQCPLKAARHVPEIAPAAALLGRSVDVAAELMVVRGGHRGSAWASACEVWEADGTDDLDLIAGLSESDREALAQQVDTHAAQLAATLGTVPSGWWPRAQDTLSVPFAGGRVVLGARFDLFLGGGASGRPSIVIEIKAGQQWPGHLEDSRYYALLAALRDGSAPALSMSLTARDCGLISEPIRAAVLDTAAERLLGALDTVFEIAAGGIMDPRPGGGCRTCSLVSECAPGRSHLDVLDRDRS